MLHIIIVDHAPFLPTVLSSLEAHAIPSDLTDMTVYKNANLLVVDASRVSDIDTVVSAISKEYVLDSLFLLTPAYAVSDEKRAGDIILPNVFFRYNSLLDEHEVNAENRDRFVENARFISQYDRQNDYDFESFGLSVGGIHVSGDQAMSEELRIKIRLAYEADTFGRTVFDFVRTGEWLGLSEKIYPVEAIVGGDEAETARNAVHIIRFFIGSLDTEMGGTLESDEEWGE